MGEKEKTIWDFINSINNKNYIWDENSEKIFQPYIVNMAFSYYEDTIFFANEMNKFQNISKKQLYDFYFYGVSKKKRWSKWIKNEKNNEFILEIAKLYNVSYDKAVDIEHIISLDDKKKKYFEELLKNKGGKE